MKIKYEEGKRVKHLVYKCPKCNKIIVSLYEKQLEYLSKVHELTHNKQY